MSPRVLLAITVTLLAVPGTAVAAHSKAFKDLVKQGETLYHDGKYADAALKLKEAYEVEPNLKVLYNIARAFEQSGNLTEALAYYQRYAASTEGTDPTLLKRSQLSIEKLTVVLQGQDAERKKQSQERERAEAETKAAQEREKAAQERARVEAEGAEKARAESNAQRVAEVAAAQQSRGQRRVTSYVLGAFGVLSIGAGVIFGVLANSAHSRFVDAPDVATKDGLISTTRTYALIADIGFAVGAAALITTVLVFPKGSEPTVQVAVAPGLGGFALVGRF